MWAAKAEPPAGVSGPSSSTTPTWLELLAFIGTISLTGFLISYLRPVLMPLVVAVFLSYLVRPLADCITGQRSPFCYRRIMRWRRRNTAATSEERETLLPAKPDEEAQKPSPAEPAAPVLRVPHAVGVLFAMLIALGIIAAIATAVAFSIFSLEESFEEYKDRAYEIWLAVLNWLTKNLHFDARTENEALPQEFYKTVIMPFLGTMVQVIANTLLVIVFLIFVMLLPPPPKGSFRDQVDDLMSEYLFIKCNLACVVGLTVYLFFLAVDLPLRFCIGLATVVLFTIPNIGPLIAALLPVPIVLLEDYAMHKALAIVLVPAVIHVFVGNFIEPFLFSGKFSLTPIVVLLSLGFWMLLWGIPGALLAIPLTCLVRIGFDFVGDNWPDVPYVKGSSSAFRGIILDGGTKVTHKES